MIKKETFGKLLFVFGIAVFLGAMADSASILLPLQLGNVQWVYSTTKAISQTCLVPILGILSIIGGFYLIITKESKMAALVESTTSIISGLLAGFLIVITLIFSMSINSLETQMISGIKGQGENLKNQITELAAKNPGTPQEKVDALLHSVDEKLVLQVNSVSKSFLKENIKIFINLIVFIIAYIMVTLTMWNNSRLTGKKLRYEGGK